MQPKLTPVNDMLLLEPFDKVRRKHDSSSPFVTAVSSNNLATVKFSSSEAYPVGVQVYFGGHYEKILVDGTELIAIKAENIIAKVVEPSHGNQS